MGSERLAVVWQGEVVGFLDDPVPDMWYLEGRWTSAGIPATLRFIEESLPLDARSSVLQGSDLWVELKSVDAGREDRPIDATVMCAPGETLFVRRMIGGRPSATGS
jgi:hypothetical protein